MFSIKKTTAEMYRSQYCWTSNKEMVASYPTLRDAQIAAEVLRKDCPSEQFQILKNRETNDQTVVEIYN